MKAKWSKRYELSISENITVKGIQQLCDCGQPKAMEIRNNALAYCGANNIDIYTRSVPTDAVLKIINKDIQYYYDKMIQESKIIYA